jgi:hypothetical protein
MRSAPLPLLTLAFAVSLAATLGARPAAASSGALAPLSPAASAALSPGVLASGAAGGVAAVLPESLPAVLPELVALPRFTLTTSFLDLAPQAASASPSIVVPPRYGWIIDEGRPFWFAAGASSVVALGTHVLVGFPTLVITGSAAGNVAQSSPAAALPLLLGVGGAYMLAQTALSSLTAFLVFNATSKVYDGNWLVAFGAHVAGTLLGAAVSALPFGTGFMLYGGLEGLSEFTGRTGLGAVAVLSVLGALPAIVIGGIALIGVPAIIGSWAMAISATPKEGYAIHRGPPPAPPQGPPASPPTARASDIVPVPMMALAIPGT